ncbi:unnamed protein product [Boreogadus saida]
MVGAGERVRYLGVDFDPWLGLIKADTAGDLHSLGISKDCVSRVAQYYAETAEARPERRGGARHSEEHSRRQLIVEHIQSFTCRASHYGRRGAPGHKYLPSDQMHKLFEAQNHAQTSYSLYYSVFYTQLQMHALIVPSLRSG